MKEAKMNLVLLSSIKSILQVDLRPNQILIQQTKMTLLYMHMSKDTIVQLRKTLMNEISFFE